MTFSLRPQAKEDLRVLLEHIVKDNLPAAYRVRDAIIETCTLLANNPRIAQEIEGLSMTGVHRFPVSGFRRYTIYYIIKNEDVEIIRLGFGGRDWESILEE